MMQDPSETESAEPFDSCTLETALEARLFSLAPWPIVKVTEITSSGACLTTAARECLLRLNTGISPARIVELANQNGLARLLDCSVLETAIAQRVNEIKWSSDILTAINVTATFPLDPERVGMLLGYCRKFDIDPRKIIIELSEDTDLSNPDVERHVEALRGLGFLVYIDDFGCDALKDFDALNIERLELDGIKVDRSVLYRLASAEILERDSAGLQIISIFRFAEEHKLQLVLEGIESQLIFFNLLDLLSKADLQNSNIALQGYFINTVMADGQPSHSVRLKPPVF